MVIELETIGWNDRFESLFAPYRVSNLIPARVTRVDPGTVTVQFDTGVAMAPIAGQIDSHGEVGPPAVGDWVGMDLIGNDGVVRVILPRAGALAGRRPGQEDHEQVAAANVDLVLVVEALDRGPNPRRIERACAIAWDGGATPIVVLTKLDLCHDADAAVARAREGAPFADVFLVSAKIGVGMAMLASRLAEGSTAVLLGPSGAGKSTLTNRLLGEERLEAADVREADRRGRHTTTFRELFVLPHGACLIDTPGVRELGLSLVPEAAGSAIPEIEEASRIYFFPERRHETEPGCAVQEGTDPGHFNVRRLASFLRFRREAESLEMSRNASKRQEIPARDRRSGKMSREATGYKKDR